MLQPPFWPKIGVFELGFLKPKTMMLNNKHNSKSGRKKDKKKRFQRENKTGNQKKITHSLKTKKLQFYTFMLFYLFMTQKQRRKNNEKRDKNKKRKESQRRKTRRKNERQEEKRDRERETEKGEAKKG